MPAAILWTSGWSAVGSSSSATTLEIGAKINPGVPVKTSVSSCQTRFMTISVARMDVATMPPARASLVTLKGLPASLTSTPSKQALGERKHGWPVAS